MKDFLMKLLSGKDNATPDVSRILLLLGAIAMVFYTGYDVIVHNTVFDAGSFGIAFGTLLAAGGAGIAIKGKTEPGTDVPE